MKITEEPGTQLPYCCCWTESSVVLGLSARKYGYPARVRTHKCHPLPVSITCGQISNTEIGLYNWFIFGSKFLCIGFVSVLF